MRDAARLKAGFFPVANSALDRVLRSIVLEDPSQTPILDPCAGEGDALTYLADGLEIPPANRWGIELDATRGGTLRERLPEGNAIAPASFFGCGVKANAFSIVYCNPPYDDLVGGNRVELLFYNAAIDLVAPGGLFIGVFPERVVLEHMKTPLMMWCNQISFEPLPREVRHYNEVFVIGVKREHVANPMKLDWNFERSTSISPRRYKVPPAPGPLAGRWPKWSKEQPTHDELHALLRQSPLRKHLTPPPVVTTMPRPPLALSKGHLALMLASGFLNGLVEPEGEPPHVVRGTASKVESIADVEETETEHETKTVTIHRERIQLTVRAVGADGEIKTFCS